MAGSINRPKDKRIVDPATGRLDLEWDAYFSRFEAQLTATASAVDALVDDAGPVAAVASGAVSAQATLDLTLGTADMYEIDLINFKPVTDLVGLYARFSQSGSFISSAGAYAWGASVFGGGAGSNSATEIRLDSANIGNASNDALCCTARIFRPSVAAFIKNLTFCGASLEISASNLNQFQGSGTLLANANAIDGVQFFFSSGNIASGFYALRSYSFT